MRKASQVGVLRCNLIVDPDIENMCQILAVLLKQDAIGRFIRFIYMKAAQQDHVLNEVIRKFGGFDGCGFVGFVVLVRW